MTDPRAVVRAGYDTVSQHYRGDSDAPPEYARWLAQLWRGEVCPSCGDTPAADRAANAE